MDGLQREISRLKLGNQRLTITVHNLDESGLADVDESRGMDGGGDNALGDAKNINNARKDKSSGRSGNSPLKMALVSCRRRVLSPRLDHSKGEIVTSRKEYLDSKCIWNYLHPYDDYRNHRSGESDVGQNKETVGRRPSPEGRMRSGGAGRRVLSNAADSPLYQYLVDELKIRRIMSLVSAAV